MDNEVSGMEGHPGDYSFEPVTPGRVEGGLQLQQIPDSDSPQVSSTPPGSTQNVPITSVMQLSKAERKKAITGKKAELKAIKREIRAQREVMKQADGPIDNRIQAVIRLVSKERELDTKKADLKVLEDADKSGTRRWLSHAVSRSYWGFKRSAAAGRTNSPAVAFINLGIDAEKAISRGQRTIDELEDNKLCDELLQQGQARLIAIGRELKNPSIKRKEAEKLTNEKVGLELAMAFLTHRKALNGPERAAQEAALGMTQLFHSALVVGTTVGATLDGASSVMSHLPGLALIGAALSIDGVQQARKNLQQAKDDTLLVKAQQREMAKVRQRLATFDAILAIPEVAGSRLGEGLTNLNVRVKSAQAKLESLDAELINGNLSRARVAEIREEKAECRKVIDNCMTLALDRASALGFEGVFQRLKTQKLLLQSAGVLESVVLPFLDQRLRNKVISEYLRGAGEVLNLTGAVIATGGAIASLTGPGVVAGGPMLIAGGAIAGVGAATIYGGSALVNIIRVWPVSVGDEADLKLVG